MVTLLRKKNPALEALDRNIEYLTLRLQTLSDSFRVAFMPTDKVVNIPHNEYAEIADGVSSRLITESDNLEEFTELYAAYIHGLDFANNYVIGVRFEKGIGLPLHFHEFDETLVVLEGNVEIDDKGSTIGPGSKLVIPKGVVHKFTPLTQGYAIALVKK